MDLMQEENSIRQKWEEEEYKTTTGQYHTYFLDLRCDWVSFGHSDGPAKEQK